MLKNILNLCEYLRISIKMNFLIPVFVLLAIRCLNANIKLSNKFDILSLISSPTTSPPGTLPSNQCIIIDNQDEFENFCQKHIKHLNHPKKTSSINNWLCYLNETQSLIATLIQSNNKTDHFNDFGQHQLASNSTIILESIRALIANGNNTELIQNKTVPNHNDSQLFISEILSQKCFHLNKYLSRLLSIHFFINHNSDIIHNNIDSAIKFNNWKFNKITEGKCYIEEINRLKEEINKISNNNNNQNQSDLNQIDVSDIESIDELYNVTSGFECVLDFDNETFELAYETQIINNLTQQFIPMIYSRSKIIIINYKMLLLRKQFNLKHLDIYNEETNNICFLNNDNEENKVKLSLDKTHNIRQHDDDDDDDEHKLNFNFDLPFQIEYLYLLVSAFCVISFVLYKT